MPQNSAQVAKDLVSLVDIAKVDSEPGFEVRQMRVDLQGNVYLMGRLYSDYFTGWPLIGSPGNEVSRTAIIKLNSTLDQVLYRRLFAISGGASELEVDEAGNAYLAGSTTGEAFPSTAKLKPETSHGGFVMKLNQTGELEYATLLGDTLIVNGIGLEPDGAVLVGGYADANELEVTRPPIPATSEPQPVPPEALVLELAPDGNSARMAAYFDHGLHGRTVYDRVEDVAVQPSGDIVLVSDQWVVGFAANADHATFATEIPYRYNVLTVDPSGNLNVYSDWLGNFRKYTADGELVYEDHFAPYNYGAIASRPDGSVISFRGGAANETTRNSLYACAADLPPGFGGLGKGDPSLTTALMTLRGPEGNIKFASYLVLSSLSYVLSPDGRYLYGEGKISDLFQGPVRLDLTKIPTEDRLSPACIGHGAILGSTPLSPGAIMSLFGSSLGPADGVSFTLVDGKVPAELSGTKITVNGKPAPILYAQDNQVNFITPWSLAVGDPVEVCIDRAGDHRCLHSQTAPFVPGAFHIYNADQTNWSVVINPDGTLNTDQNPVPGDSYVTMYITGAGLLTGELVDGAVSSLDFQYVKANLEAGILVAESPPCVTSCASTLVHPEIQYAGSAPGLVSGVVQINLYIPAHSLLNFYIDWRLPDGSYARFQDRVWVEP